MMIMMLQQTFDRLRNNKVEPRTDLLNEDEKRIMRSVMKKNKDMNIKTRQGYKNTEVITK
jgi:hypothetical protein